MPCNQLEVPVFTCGPTAQLSSKIDGFETAIHRLKPPLLVIESRIRSVRDVVATAVTNLTAALSRRDSTRAARCVWGRYLRLRIDGASHSVFQIQILEGFVFMSECDGAMLSA
jgi:hypothetical protein